MGCQGENGTTGGGERRRHGRGERKRYERGAAGEARGAEVTGEPREPVEPGEG